MHAAELWRYPVKSLAGERLEETDLRAGGIPGDPIGAGSVEQANDGRVDVPHLVGSSGSKPDLRFRRVNSKSWPSPAEFSCEAMPGRGGRQDFAEPLRQDGERPSGNVTVLGRRHHVVDRPDLRWCQSMRRRVRTGQLIVECAHGVPPLPGVEPTRGQPEEPLEGPQRNPCAALIDGTQDSQLVETIG